MAYEVNVDNFDRDDWEHYAEEFADYSIYQTWAYQQVRAEMDGQDISRVVIKDENGKVVTMCQVRIKHVKPIGLKIGYGQWGPLFRRKDGNVRCTIEALRKLREAYVGTKLSVLRVVPNIYKDETGEKISEMLICSGFQHVRSAAPYQTMMLRVDDSGEGIRKRFGKSFRRDLNHAEKATIEIREGTGGEFCAILEKLYLELLKRKGFKGLEPQVFIKAQSMLSTPEKMNIIVAYLGNEPVAVHLASNLGDTAIALLAASNEQGLSCGSSYIVWYRSAVSALNAGMKLYDVGGIDPDNNPNVYRFKSRMGGEEVFHIGAFDACSRACTKVAWRVCEKICNLVKR
jgi:lipid II:glycine glycyltransferase (peptidoglycan interpeptide bridge formation enzyme)